MLSFHVCLPLCICKRLCHEFLHQIKKNFQKPFRNAMNSFQLCGLICVCYHRKDVSKWKMYRCQWFSMQLMKRYQLLFKIQWFLDNPEWYEYQCLWHKEWFVHLMFQLIINFCETVNWSFITLTLRTGKDESK